jgi:glycosyltransferase involved in cell wall biosynthesis
MTEPSRPDARPTVRILGTHGIPAAYGGFETAAQNVAKWLVANGWRAIVYCQAPGRGPIVEDEWNGIERVTIPVDRDGWLGTSSFDWKSIRHALPSRDLCLTFGYNTAVFNIAQRFRGVPNVINMDGIEWSRARWGIAKQTILYVNERIACWVGDRLIADHPEIERYLRRKARASKLVTITYGADVVTDAPSEPVTALNLEPGRYLTLVCRPIPENTILELVTAFSARPRGVRLVVVGRYDSGDDYHRAVREAAGAEVDFPGAIYDPDELAALRFHSLGYLHGHTVGGTNPSLVEAMAAGNAVIAHDNPYNRWVAGDGALYFRDTAEADARITTLLEDGTAREALAAAARARHASEFTWEHVAGQYESLLASLLAERTRPRVPRSEGVA